MKLRHIQLSTACAAAPVLSSAVHASDKAVADGAGMRHAASGNAVATAGPKTDIKADTLIGKSVELRELPDTESKRSPL